MSVTREKKRENIIIYTRFLRNVYILHPAITRFSIGTPTTANTEIKFFNFLCWLSVGAQFR